MAYPKVIDDLKMRSRTHKFSTQNNYLTKKFFPAMKKRRECFVRIILDMKRMGFC